MIDGYISPWWQAALIPPRWDVCGIKVNAISVWHMYALTNIENVYIVGGVPNRDAAAGLLMICGTDMAGCKALFHDARTSARAMRAVSKAIARVPWEDLDGACRDFVASCTRIPVVKVVVKRHGEDVDQKYFASPLHRLIVMCLCSQYRMTLDEAWNHPYADARCMFNVWRESEKGDDSIADERWQRIADASTKRGAA